ncbi:hypothetical protein L3Y34_010578 [Caenorhabditis briggsae]|uniref:Uncharacterized protein n=1 Tax=Caenorhabditis briggsae TaxID=6238 RepID=A0AAE9CSU1_CAEBR|nr:hypothetical protein L3Y34_010578 [Caenorhabditis briggsae]
MSSQRKPELRSINTARQQTKRAKQRSPDDALWQQMPPKAKNMWSNNCSKLLKLRHKQADEGWIKMH